MVLITVLFENGAITVPFENGAITVLCSLIRLGNYFPNTVFIQCREIVNVFFSPVVILHCFLFDTDDMLYCIYPFL